MYLLCMLTLPIVAQERRDARGSDDEELKDDAGFGLGQLRHVGEKFL